MKAKLINEIPERTFALVFDRGDEVMSLLERFAVEQGVIASFQQIDTVVADQAVASPIGRDARSARPR